jgi:EAL domain-containing protein (putative c-di-GMP-specific phosphodiesterase class I)
VFVPLAERVNLMPKVDLWVVARAVRLATRLPDDADFAFAINLSKEEKDHFYQDLFTHHGWWIGR